MNKRKQKKANHRHRSSAEKTVSLYSKTQFDRDEKAFNNSITGSEPIDWGCFQRLMMHDLCMSNIIESNSIGSHSLENIQAAIRYPRNNYQILLDTSDYLMRISPHYYKLNQMYSNMALFCWWIDLYDVKDNVNTDTVKKLYGALSAKLESMNLKHEFSKIMKVLPYQDVYYGLIVEDKNNFFIQQIDYKICKLCQVQDGLFDFAINLSAIKDTNINAYPDFIQKALSQFLDGEISKWYIPPADKQICLKFNSQWTYPFPFMIGLIQDILDLNIYKKLKLQSARTDNYKAIMVKVPIDEDKVDKPLLTPETLSVFAQMNRESMSDDIGLLHILGSSGEAISFKDSNNSRNNVADAVDDIYNSSGVTKELFNGSSSGTAVTFSIENDSAFIYGVYRQFERWVNRLIKTRKYNKSSFKFLFYLLDITIFNRDNVSKRYKEACTLGVTVIDKWLATLDMTPSRMLGSYFMHENIFNFHEKFTPLTSSYTTSSSEAGRPTSESQGKPLDESGEKTKNSDGNIDR